MLDEKITKKLFNESVLNEKIKGEVKKLSTKAELKAEQDKIVILQELDLSIFIDQR